MTNELQDASNVTKMTVKEERKQIFEFISIRGVLRSCFTIRSNNKRNTSHQSL
ncbi:hypothetical protein WN51_11637 [Melipona quadrifasciata]|uniref:Uncharacterized protein n=1 Tax=Melipona quadrifasciata TaxID=166423 RepID=A0A0M9A4I2_9HYME|nr:hypothetical protein WN51_11637 [Melipona quadrifasciata]